MTGKDLKNSILQLAIQGKLVPQDDNDEPASELLARIREEKERLVKEKKLKKKDLETTPIEDYEKPFEIPESWEWVRLNNLALVARGGSPRPIKDYITESSNGVNWIKIGDTEKGGKYINSCAERIKPEGVQHSRKVHPGDFLLTNSMSFGRPYITNIEGCIHDGWLVISQHFIGYDPDYLYYLLSSPFAIEQFASKSAGAVVQNLNKDKVAESVFPLPPLAEQQRIVAKIEELMPLVEEYDKNAQKLEALNRALPERLRQSVLQQAIMGKLVPQDDNDEPASELLTRIRQEKERLVKEKKLKKKDLETTPIEDYEKPFEIPESWEWCRLGDIISLLSGQDLTPDRYYDIEKGIPYITGASHFVDGSLVISRWTESATSVSHRGDLLITCKGTVGAMAYNNVGDIHIARQVMAINPILVYLPYIQYFLSHIVPELEKQAHSIIPGISREVLLSSPLPLPPLSEQQRIVAKIEELFSVIDNLKTY